MVATGREHVDDFRPVRFARGPLEGLSIHDVGVTALALLGLDAPDGWLGKNRA